MLKRLKKGGKKFGINKKVSTFAAVFVMSSLKRFGVHGFADVLIRGIDRGWINDKG